jgi:murein hydrolase activator
MLVCCIGFVWLYAQSRRSALERKRQIIMERMKETKSQLNETAQNKRKTAQNYAALQGNIEKKDATIGVINEQLDNSSESLIRKHEVIASLNDDLLQLRSDYGEVIRKTFRDQLNHNFLNFFFASDDFNQLSQRFFYVKNFDQFKKRQVFLIKATLGSLRERINHLELKIEQKEQTLDDLNNQKSVLSEKLDVESDKLSDLSKAENRLKNDLRIQQRQAERLSATIESVISAEIAERKRVMQEAANAISAYRSKADNEVKTERSVVKSRRRKHVEVEQESMARTSDIELRETPEIKALSDNFRNNKGSLPWPVRKGSITRFFGKQEHPTLRGIFTISNGIDIQTDANSEVTAVAGGKVVAVQFIVGSDYLIIVQHGNFYTVYSNLDRSFVKKGDTISFKQSIGKVSGNKVHFEVWNNSSRENPKNWLAKI